MLSKVASKSVRRGPAGLIRWFSHDASKYHSNRGNMREFKKVLNPEVGMALKMAVFTRSIGSIALKMGSKEVFYNGNFSSSSQLHLQRTFSSNADLPPPQEIGMPSLSSTMTDGRKRGQDLATKHGYLAPSLTIFNEKAKFSSTLETAASKRLLHTCFTTAVNPVAPVTHGVTPETNLPRIKFKRLDKTARHIMQIVDNEAVEEVKQKRDFPDIKLGYIIQLKLEVPENRRRITTIKGIVIARRNAGLNSTFRIRRLVAGIGVESLLPLYSPNIKDIKVLDKKKVRRAKLYYLREKMNPLKK